MKEGIGRKMNFIAMLVAIKWSILKGNGYVLLVNRPMAIQRNNLNEVPYIGQSRAHGNKAVFTE